MSKYDTSLGCGSSSRPTFTCSEEVDSSLAIIANKYINWIYEDQKFWGDSDALVQEIVDITATDNQEAI